MARNIDHRVEILAPIRDRSLVRYLKDEVLAVYLADNVKARYMQSNGIYVRKKATEGKHRVNSQEKLLKRSGGKHKPKSRAEM